MEENLREIKITTDFLEKPFSSVLFESGKTKVLVSVSVNYSVPSYVEENQGWLTAEYALLPASTDTRNRRERKGIGGRTAEIQRIIGRSLRMAVDRTLMPGITLVVDADVLQADGGTRTASINGAMLALFIAGKKLVKEGVLEKNPVVRWIGAISSGMIDGQIVVDLDYEKDFKAESDFNFVFSDKGEIIEIQGTSEKAPLENENFLQMMNLSKDSILKIINQMKEIGANYQ